METEGYSSLYIQRSGQKRDGCGIFYKISWYVKTSLILIKDRWVLVKSNAAHLGKSLLELFACKSLKCLIYGLNLTKLCCDYNKICRHPLVQSLKLISTELKLFKLHNFCWHLLKWSALESYCFLSWVKILQFV